MKYMISYDLRKPGRNYETLYAELKRFKAQRILESQWVFKRINTNSVGLRDHFKGFIDNNDRLLIVEINGTGWASWNIMFDINKV